MKIFLFSFKMAIKTAGSAQKKKKTRVGRVSGNTAIFFGLIKRPFRFLPVAPLFNCFMVPDNLCSVLCLISDQ